MQRKTCVHRYLNTHSYRTQPLAVLCKRRSRFTKCVTYNSERRGFSCSKVSAADFSPRIIGLHNVHSREEHFYWTVELESPTVAQMATPRACVLLVSCLSPVRTRGQAGNTSSAVGKKMVSRASCPPLCTS